MQAIQTSESSMLEKFAKEHPNEVKSYYKTVTMHTNKNGTATITEKTKNSNGDTTEVTKTVTDSKLNTISL